VVLPTRHHRYSPPQDGDDWEEESGDQGMMAGGGWMMAWQGSNGAQRTGDPGVKGRMVVLRRVRFMVDIARLQPAVEEGQKPHMVERDPE